MLPYVFYNCFYETTHNIYRQKISWPTNEQLQYLSCRRLLTHTDTANSRAASITATYYYRQRRYHHYQLFTFTLNHHQWVWHRDTTPTLCHHWSRCWVNFTPRTRTCSSCAALCDQFDESSIFTTCKAFHEWNVIVSTARAGSQSCLLWEWCWLNSAQCSSWMRGTKTVPYKNL